MKKVYFGFIILILSSIFNYYKDFGFALSSDIIMMLWLMFYLFVLPITLITCVFVRNKSSLELSKISLISFVLYLVSTLLSGVNLVDFQKFIIIGDRATRYVISVIYLICFITSLLSFLLFQLKIRKQR